MLTAKSPISRILLIKFRGIGDVILSTVVLKNIKSRYPDAVIDFLTEKPSAPLLRDIPGINSVIVFEGNRSTELFRKIMLIRKRKYDLIIDMYSNPKSAQLTFASGARFRAGFPYRGRKYAYNLFGPPERGVHHAGDLHLKFLEEIGIPVVARESITAVPATEKLWAEEYFSSLSYSGPLIALVPGGGWASKRCDPEKFAEIGNELSKRYGVKSLVLWGKGDLDEAKKIVELMGQNAILAPDSTFLQMGALALGCKLAVANDSGPMHFISSLGVPVLALHGPTDPALQGPFGEKHETVRLEELDCICCNLLECNRGHECFRELPLERVMAKIDSLISKNGISF